MKKKQTSLDKEFKKYNFKQSRIDFIIVCCFVFAAIMLFFVIVILSKFLIGLDSQSIEFVGVITAALIYAVSAIGVKLYDKLINERTYLHPYRINIYRQYIELVNRFVNQSSSNFNSVKNDLLDFLINNLISFEMYGSPLVANLYLRLYKTLMYDKNIKDADIINLSFTLVNAIRKDIGVSSLDESLLKDLIK